MKRLLCLALSLLLLCGCSASGSYVYTRAHQEAQAASDPDAINSRAELTEAVSAMIRAGVQSDTLLIADYQGDLNADLETVTAELTEKDPYGAFAVSSIVCKQVSIVSRTELTVSVQYSRPADEIAAVVEAPTADDLGLRIAETFSGFSSDKAFYLSGVYVSDPEALAEKCWLQDPVSAVGLKSFTVTAYPATGLSRILELRVEYLDTPEKLRSMSADIRSAAAAVCASYGGSSDRDKLDFVYAYLRDSVRYDTDAMRVVAETGGRQAHTSLYTAYGALLENRAAQSGIALAAKALCDELKLPASVISGTLDGEPYIWLVVTLDGVAWHFDPTSRLAAAAGGYTDLFSMTEGRRRFVWDKSLYGIY